VDRIKRISNELLNEYSERFGTDFSTNKQTLNEISIIRSKGLKNELAGYITKMLQRQAKFEERKQMIIDNEKKSQERQNLRSRNSEIPSIVKPDVKTEESEQVATDEKTVAEEIVDESKSE
jgi:small subunit ribosomal protein S17e